MWDETIRGFGFCLSPRVRLFARTSFGVFASHSIRLIQSPAMTTTYEALVKWIAQGGGYVHPELELRGTGSDRGIFAKSLIRCGESLMPFMLVIQQTTITAPKKETQQQPHHVVCHRGCVVSWHCIKRRQIVVFINPTWIPCQPTMKRYSIGPRHKFQTTWPVPRLGNSSNRNVNKTLYKLDM